MYKHKNSSYHKKHKFTEGGVHILFGTKLVKPHCHEENSISKLKQKRKSDKQIDLMGMKQDRLLFLHKVFFGGVGGESFACVDRKM